MAKTAEYHFVVWCQMAKAYALSTVIPFNFKSQGTHLIKQHRLHSKKLCWLQVAFQQQHELPTLAKFSNSQAVTDALPCHIHLAINACGS